MINKLDLSSFSFTLFYTHKIFILKGGKNKENKGGGGGEGLSKLLFVEDCMNDWKTSII